MGGGCKDFVKVYRYKVTPGPADTGIAALQRVKGCVYDAIFRVCKR